jgi:hypothetical protein
MAFRQRYQKEPIAGASTRTFEGIKWYKKSPKLASLAAPGTSQHNSGLAIDIHTASEPKRLNWLIDNVRKFGFSWEVVPEEPWHIRYTEGDTPPPAVIDFVSKRDNKPAEQVAQPAQGQDKSAEAASLPIVNQGFKGHAVKKAQRLLQDHGIPCLQDGSFGPKTQEAVRKFQTSKGLPATGEVDTSTWAALLS